MLRLLMHYRHYQLLDRFALAPKYLSSKESSAVSAAVCAVSAAVLDVSAAVFAVSACCSFCYLH